MQPLRGQFGDRSDEGQVGPGDRRPGVCARRAAVAPRERFA
jgi:hypothetical protein